MKLLRIIAAVMTLATSVFSQSTLLVLEQKAPPYPPAARAVRAAGEVIVETEVGSDGKVTEAKAISGHPLLRAASVETAKKWVFARVGDSTGRTRKINLFFNFEIGDRDSVPESDQAESYIVRSFFPAAYSVQVSSVFVQPRLLLLPKKDGKIPKEFCPLHDHEMSVEVRPLICNPDDDLEYGRNYRGDFDTAQYERFRYANVAAFRHDCGLTEREEVYYCSVCRANRAAWLRDNS